MKRRFFVRSFMLACVTILILLIAGLMPAAPAGEQEEGALSAETRAGLKLHKSWRWSEAIRVFDKAISADPKDLNARFFRSWDLFLGGHPDLGVKDMDEVIRLLPDVRSCYNNRAVDFFGMGDYERAVKDARSALEISKWNDKFDPYTVILLYLSERRMGHKDAANSLLKEGVTKCDTTAWPYNLLLMYVGKMSEDQVMIKVGDVPKKTSLKSYAGLLHLANGDSRKARQYFRWCMTDGQPEGTGWDLALNELRGMDKINPSSADEARKAVLSER